MLGTLKFSLHPYILVYIHSLLTLSFFAYPNIHPYYMCIVQCTIVQPIPDFSYLNILGIPKEYSCYTYVSTFQHIPFHTLPFYENPIAYCAVQCTYIQITFTVQHIYPFIHYSILCTVCPKLHPYITHTHPRHTPTMATFGYLPLCPLQ